MKIKIQKVISWIKEHSNWIKIIFLASVFLFVINQMTQILQGMTWADLGKVMSAQKKTTLLLMGVIGIISVLPMILYDWVTVEILVDHGKPKLARKELISSAWITNTINNFAGFGGVIGATLRANFYGKGVPQKKVVTTVSKVAFFMLSGLSILCLATFCDLNFFTTNTLYGDYWIWLLGGGLFTPVLLGFIWLKRKSLFADFTLKRIFKLLCASTGQWLGALASFLLIGKLLAVPVSLLEIYPLFIAATLIGMISMVPGGMGTFDVLIILGLTHVGISKELAVVWLLYYRFFYYIVPFFTGVLLFIHQTGARVNVFFDGLPKLMSQKTAHFFLVCMLYFAGIMMVLLSTVPNLSNISQLFNVLLPFSFNLLDQTLNMIMGFLLLGLARGFSSHVKKAYMPTLVLLALCILNTISRTVSWKLVIFYVFIMACVYLSRKELYRKQLVYSWEAMLFDGILFTFLLVLYSIVGIYVTDAFDIGGVTPDFLLFPSDAVWFSGLAGLLIAVITLLFLYHYLSSTEQIGEDFNQERILHMLRTYGGDENSQLLFLKEKQNYYYEESGWDKVMFSFQKSGNKLFVIGNPIGDKNKLVEGTLEFMKKADRLGYQLAFYKISKEYMLLLHDFGFDFIKAGEEGYLNLQETTNGLIDASTEKLVVKRLRNLGYTFQLVEAPVPMELLNELEKVSDEWVRTRGEKYFSVGRFKRAYVGKQRVGIVRDSAAKIIAFISVKEMYQAHEVSYDLLRYVDEAPEGIQDFLLTHLFVACRAKGYEIFDMGIAPLANVGDTRFSYFKERMLNVLYQYGSRLVDFQDQRLYKENYVSVWEPQYLAYKKSSKLTFVLLQLILLVGKKRSRKYNPVDSILVE